MLVSSHSSTAHQTPCVSESKVSTISRSPLVETLKTRIQLPSEESKRTSLFQKLEGRDVEMLNEITQAVRSFDR